MEEKIRKNLWWIVPLLFSGLLYFNSLKGIFFWDDRGVILENTAVKNWSSSVSTFRPDYWLRSHPGSKGQYRPLRNLTFTLDYSLWHTQPLGYHLTNYLLNIAAVLLVCLVARALFLSDGAALLAGLVFSAHPMHAETVNFIKNRSDMLCLILLLLSFYGFLKNRRILSWTAFFFALFAKEFAVVFPLVLLLTPKERKRPGLKETAPYFLLSAALVYVKLTLLKTGGTEIIDPLIAGVKPFWVVVSTVVQYFYLLFFPFHLELDRQLGVIQSPFSPALLFFVLFWGAAGYGLVRLKSGYKPVYIFAIAWIFLFLGPVSNLIPLTGRLLAEQRLYVPSAGLAFLAGGLGRELYSKYGVYKKYLAGIFLAGLFVFGYLIISRNTLWSNELMFWAQTVRENPSNMRAYDNLAASFMRAGDYESAERIYKKMLPRFPKESAIYTNLAVMAQARGDMKAALEYFEEARRLAPGDAQVCMNLGSVYFLRGDRKKAMELYLRASELAPGDAGLYTNLGVLYAGEKKFDAAAGFFKKAVELDPDLVEARLNLANVYKALGLKREAEAEQREAQARMRTGAQAPAYNPAVTFK